MKSLTRFEFEQTLTPQRLSVFTIVYAALIVGILLFGIIVFAWGGNNEAGGEQQREVLLIMSIIHIVLALSMYGAASLVFNQMLNAKQLLSSGETFPAEKIFKALLNAYIFRVALFESAAIFGLVTCLLTFQWGFAEREPEFLLNGLSAVYFLFMAVTTFPTKERLIGLFIEYFEHAPV